MQLPSRAFSSWTKYAEAITGMESAGRAWVAGVIVQLPGAVWLHGKMKTWSLNGVQRHSIRSFAGDLQSSSLSLLIDGSFFGMDCVAGIADVVSDSSHMSCW